ncbi:MAG: hypothetical protein ACRDAX_08250 [Propionibacteriaceae bacterium]
MADSLDVGFNPVPAAERVARWHAIVKSRLIILTLLAIASVALWFFRRSWLSEFSWLLGFMAVASVIWIAAAWLLWYVSKKDLKALEEGIALSLTYQGVALRGQQIAWEEVTRVVARSGGPWRSPLLIVEHRNLPSLSLPLDYLDRSPGELDNAIRAFTRGRLGLDLSGIGV